MEPQRIVDGIYLLPFEIGQVYLWEWAENLTVIDTGMAGSADAILAAIESIGRRPEDVREIVLTHSHVDHRGGAPELARRTGATVIAHRADAPVIEGRAPEPPPLLMDFERPIFEAVMPKVLPAEPVRVDREVDDGDALAGGATVVGVPGHTAGSIAIHIPALRALFSGDTLANVGTLMLGVFNVDRAEAIRSAKKQAELDVDVACFGHGDPIVGGAGLRLRALAASL